MIQLEEIIGMPPPGSIISNNNLKLNSMPVMEIIPCVPGSAESLNLYKLKNARGSDVEEDDKFDPKLEKLGFSVSDPILIAFQAENFPSDTFNNEYGETFLNKLTDVASEGVSEMMQLTNTKNASQAAQKIGTSLQNYGSVASQIGSFLASKGEQLGKWAAQEKTGGAALANKLLAGQRVDFPQIWKNSTFNASYSITVKLYNPKPANDEAHEKFIVGPLALILLLASPLSDATGDSYRWPYFHRIRCTGLFDIRAGAISSVTVNKGGDQQQVGWNQRVSVVDVRIDFVNMYSSIIAGGKWDLDRPTIESYIDSMREYDDLNEIYDVAEEPAKFGEMTDEEIFSMTGMTKSTSPDASDPYETDLERVLEEKTITEEDIIDDANGKIPTAPPTSDLRSREMGEIAVGAGGSSLTGDLATKTAAERYTEGVKNEVTESADRTMRNSPFQILSSAFVKR